MKDFDVVQGIVGAMVRDYSFLMYGRRDSMQYPTSSPTTLGRWVIIEGRRPHCWVWRQQGHIVQHCPQKAGGKPKACLFLLLHLLYRKKLQKKHHPRMDGRKWFAGRNLSPTTKQFYLQSHQDQWNRKKRTTTTINEKQQTQTEQPPLMEQQLQQTEQPIEHWR